MAFSFRALSRRALHLLTQAFAPAALSRQRLAHTAPEALEERVLLTTYVVDTTADVIGNDGFTSLREAVDAASSNQAVGDVVAGEATGDRIVFSSSVFGDGGGQETTIILTLGDLDVTDDLLIDGRTGGGFRVTLSGGNASRLFDVNTNENVVLLGLQLTGGRATDGGAVLSRGGGTTRINGSLLTGNRADNDGGGVHNTGGGLFFTRSELRNNVASGDGGGVFSSSGGLTLTETLVADNRAVGNGGGIGVAGGTVTLTNTTLGGPTAADGNNSTNGGGMHVAGSATTVMQGGSVQNNIATSEGGGLWNAAGARTSIVGGTLIADNTAQGGAADNGGGGIFNDGGTLGIGNAVIRDNDATGASGSGGGLFSTGGRVTLTGTTISGNTANRAGGGIEVIDGTVETRGATLSGNVVNNGNGGGVHVTGSANTRVFGSSLVTGNRAGREGGGLWNSASGLLQVVDSTIRGNFALGTAADDGGGGIFNNGGNAVLVRSTVDNNTADNGQGSGGGIFSAGGTIVLNDVDILSNTANRAGGGVELINGTFETRNFSVIQGNRAGINGGGLHVTGSANTRILSNTTVALNVAGSEGGGLWNSTSGLMQVADSTVQNNTAQGATDTEGGGGIFNNGGTLVVSRSLVDDNQATGASGSGGGIMSVGGLAVVNASIVSGNQANRAGGGIEIGSGELRMTGGSIIMNTALTTSGIGGGIRAGGTSELDIDSVTIEQNAAQNGGGVWVSTNSVTVIRDSVLRMNQAGATTVGQGGGGLFNAGGLVALRETTFDQNISQSDGGGILSLDGRVNVVGNTLAGDSLLTGNRSAGLGAGAAVAGGRLDLTNTRVTANVSQQSGGGVAVANDGTFLVVRGSQLVGNRAGIAGGGIASFSSADVLVSRAIVEANDAATGGGFFHQGGVLELYGSTISGNDALADATAGIRGVGGGFNIVDAATFFAENSTVSGNTAVHDGGGLAIANSAADIANLTVVANIADIDEDTDGVGGGFAIANTSLVRVDNTIVAGNRFGDPDTGTVNDVFGAFNGNSAFNLISDAGSAGGLQNNVNGNITGDGGNGFGTEDLDEIVDPVLRLNGGPNQVRTHQLLAISNALNAGSNFLATRFNGAPLTADQRDLPRTVNGIVDIGAVERQS